MKHAKYIGPDCGWNVTAGLGALIMDSDDPDYVKAQFDDHHITRSGIDLSRGWHKFPACDFEVDQSGVINEN